MVSPLPLPALQAFEAAARHASMTRAAEELGLSQAAVSYHVRRLEERLGEQLFTRRGRGLVLTSAGDRLAGEIVAAFETMRRAIGIETEVAARSLLISSVPIFGSNWLAPRIADFQHRHPELAVRIRSSTILGDNRTPEIDADVEIRASSGPFPARLFVQPLMRARLTCVTSLELASRLRCPIDLLAIPLMGHREPWMAWLTAAGVEVPASGLRADPVFVDSQIAAARASASGHGAALVSREFFEGDIASGRLVVPFDVVIERSKVYWLVCAMEKRHLPKIRAFREWIMTTLPIETNPSGTRRKLGR